MMKPLIECLHDEEVGRLLTGEIDAARTSELEQHLANCIDCRQRLEQQVGDDGWWNETESSLRSQHVAVSLRDAEDGPAYAASLGETRLRESVLDLLGPTDDPNMLGRIGPYEIIGLLGQGGMGAVFKGFDRSLNRFVAIKMLLPHLAASGAARKRFAREGQAVAAVVDDHVMAIHCVDAWQGVPYLVMTYSRGVSLQKRLSDNGPLEVREILRIGMQAAKGLAAAHAQGIVHRDIKPANIFLDKKVERVQLMDFGLARAVDDASLTRSGTLAGTPQYMSPEQARAEMVDHRSDLFSLGSVLYAMCTGHAPFRAESSYSVLRLITDTEPRSIRETNPDIPEWLCLLISRLMAKSPDARFGNAMEVAALLEQCLAHVQQPTSVSLPESLVSHAAGRRSVFNATRIGVMTMLGTIGMTLLGMVLWQKVPEAQNSTDKAPRTTANQLDEKATGKQLGTVLGKPIHEGDLNKDVSTEDNLKRLLLRPLMENYCRKLGLDRAVELKAKIQDEQSRRIASFFVLPAELNRHLFEKHGGRVILSASGAVAIDGMRKWLEAREQAGDFHITDPQLKRVFRELWVQEPLADAQFATQEEIKAAFDPDQIEYFVKREGIFNRGSERLPVDEITRMIDSIKNNTNGAKAAKRLPGITALRFGDGVDRESRQAWLEWWDREKANIDNAAAGVREFIVNGRITDPEGKPIAGATVRVHVPSKSSPTGHYQLAHTISDSYGEYVLQFGIPPFAAKEESTWQATFTALNPPRFVAHEDYLKFVKTVHRQLPEGKGTDTDYGDPVIFVGTPMPMNFKLRPASIGPDPVDADASPKIGQPEPQKRENKLPEETPDANNAQSRTKPDRGPTTQFAIGNVLYSLPFNLPSVESILGSMPDAKARPRNERIQCELVKYQVSNARHYPLVEPAQLVQAHFKSTLTSDAGREVVFSDTSHLIRAQPE